MKTLSFGIEIFEDVFMQNEELIDLAEKGPWRDGVVGTQAKADDKIRIALIHDLDANTELNKEFLEIVVEALQEYGQKYKVNLTTGEHLRVCKYPEDGFYKEHADASDGNRVVSLVLFLNNDMVGGELYFPNQELEIKPKAGSLVLFPSNYLYRHECKKVTKGMKFVGLSWFK